MQLTPEQLAKIQEHQALMRAKAHPDVSRDRARWDTVESAIRVLGGTT